MYWTGIVVGFFCFLIIGLFHPIVIKGEYYFGTRLWIVFLLSGILLFFASLFVGNFLLSSILGVTSFTCFWSIHEVLEQRKRVEKGWFPAGPSHQVKSQPEEEFYEEEKSFEADK